MSSIVDYIFTTLDGEIKKNKRDVQAVRRISERSETAGGVAQSDLDNAPLAVDGGMSGGDLLWISNGCKPGESAGAGTGVLGVYDPATDQWLRVGDYVVVTK